MMSTLSDKLVPEWIESLIPYPPGKPIEELEREYGIKDSIKLASNENPLGPSPKAVEAISRCLGKIHRYPDGSCYYLKAALSEYLHIQPDMLVFGNGSNEIIELLLKAFLRPGDEVIMGDPSFAVYSIAVKAAGGIAVQIPLKGFSYDLESMAEAVTESTRIVFIANPNNPTGAIVKQVDLEGFMGKLSNDVILVIDEAYYEYVTDSDFPFSIDYVRGGKTVVILRTFSKIYGLAGLRVGYGVANEYLLSQLNKVRQPFNVNSLAQVAARAALEDKEHLERSLLNNREGMTYLMNELDGMGLECIPSQANFFLIKVGNGRLVYEGMLNRGVIVRPMDGYGLNDYIRISVGLPTENRVFVERLKETLKEGE